MAKFRLYNRTLCPELWDRYQHLDPRARLNLLRMAYDFYEKTKFPAKIIDVYLMGSVANYNWSPESDVDVHIMIDYNQLGMPPETANKAVKTAGAQWNQEHDVLVKGHKVELNIQNATEKKPYVTGVYSLVKDQWIRKPSLQIPQLDKRTIQLQFMGMKTYIDEVIASGDRERMKEAKKYVDAYRQFGLDTQGELSYENIVFKVLRSRGLIKKLKDSINITYDREMSVKETFMDRTPKDDTPYLIVGVTNRKGESVSGVTPTGRSGHGSLSVKYGNSTAFDSPLYWRYRKMDNTLYVDTALGSVIANIPYTIQHLKDKYHIENPQVSTDPEGYLMRGHRVTETNGQKRFTLSPPDKNGVIGINLDGKRFSQIYKPAEGWGKYAGKWLFNRGGMAIDSGFPTIEKGYNTPEELLADVERIFSTLSEVKDKDIKQRLPQTVIKRDDEGSLDLSMLTLDNLKALKNKAARMVKGTSGKPDSISMEINKSALRDFIRYHDELKKRVAQINRPMDEKFDSSFTNYISHDGSYYVEVFKNPTKAEIRQCTSHDEFGLILNGNDSYVWNRDKAYHSQIRTHLKLSREALPLQVWIEGDGFSVYVSDASRFSRWYHDPNTEKFIRNHPFFSDKKLNDVRYYDEAIDGDWSEMPPKEGATVTEGFGAGIPETDRLKIKNDDGSVQRWRIRSKDAPKTPKMTDETVIAVPKYDEPQRGNCLSEGLILESPRQESLKKNRKPLTDEERTEVMKAKAVWHHGSNGEETPAVWKAIVKGKTWYCCNTHRAIQIKPTLKGAIKAFEFIKTTA